MKDRIIINLLKILPHHVLSSLAYRLTRWQWKPFKNALIRWAVHHYGINMDEALYPIEYYASFNDFFTRPLKPEARPIAQSDVISPVDARISQIGSIQVDRLIQAKGKSYGLQKLLADEKIQNWINGSFCTLYLSPKDYHRIHMPVSGTLKRMRFIPGALFSVNPATVEHIPDLFARNERLIIEFKTELGRMILIMVGAIFVGSMATVWAGEIRARQIQDWSYSDHFFQAGQEIARFNMGSTVILLFEPHQIEWRVDADQWIRMGQALADRTSN